MCYRGVKDQLGYCGIWCGSCPGGNGAVVELTRLYEEQVKKNNLEQWAPKNFDFKEFMKGLSSIREMSLCPGCLKGGGNPACGVRECSKEKGYSHCGECSEIDACGRFGELESWNPKIKAEVKKLRGKRVAELEEKWEKKLTKKWPHCLLFCKHVK
jgi:hypothetical protein